MGNDLIVLPLVSTSIALCIGLFARMLLLRKIPALCSRLSSFFLTGILTAEDLRSTLATTVDPLALLPMIEEHIDTFLRHRLGKAIPMIGMFIGDKTIAEMKKVFMIELTEILPLIMEKYMGELADGLNTRELLQKKLTAIPAEKFTEAFKRAMRKELMMIPVCSAAAGLFTGLVQYAVLLWIS